MSVQRCKRRARGWRTRAMMLLGLLVVTGAVAGCLGRSPEVRHFVLGRPPSEAFGDRVEGVALLVGPVRLPAYLERSQMARLASTGEIDLDEIHRWLGGFEENLLRAVTAGLAARLDSARVVAHPSGAPFPIDYRIRLHVDDLVDVEGRSLRARIRWSLQPTASDAPASLFVLDRGFPIDGPEREHVVTAHERALAALVESIAAAVEAAEAEPALQSRASDGNEGPASPTPADTPTESTSTSPASDTNTIGAAAQSRAIE